MKSRSVRGLLRATSASGLIVLATFPAYAQEVRGPEQIPPSVAPGTSAADEATPAPASPGAGATVGTDQNGLADIVVTARKVAENMQRVPVAITAFSGADLQQQGAVNVVDIARLTPSLAFRSPQNDPNTLSVAIRGQIQIDVLATLDPSVGVYVDGFYWARAYGLNTDLLDVRSVQVLKGPQGTLFGRNTTGGAILFETNDPDPSRLSGLVSGTYGRLNEVSVTGIANVPVAQDAAFRVAVRHDSRDGYNKDINTGDEYNGRDVWTGRAKFLWDPGGFKLLLSGEYYQNDMSGGGFAARQLAFVYPGSLGASLIGPDAQSLIQTFHDHPNAAATNLDPTSLLKTYTANGTLTVDTGFGAAKLIAGYRKIDNRNDVDFDGTPAILLQSAGNQNLWQWSLEGQLTGTAIDDRLSFASGVTFFREGGHDATLATSLPTLVPTDAATYGQISNSSFGVYSQGSFKLTPSVTATAGLRYSYETKGLEIRNRNINRTTGVVTCAVATTVLSDGCRLERSDNFSSLSYVFGLDYRPAQDVLIYAKTSKGFRSGGQNLRASSTVAFTPFQPETAFSQEAGIKSEFFDRHVRLNIAGYYTLVKDIQRSTLIAFPNGTTGTVLGNAGKARFYGGEAELTVAPMRGLTVSATGSITRPKYLDYKDLSGDRSYERFNNVVENSWSLSGSYSFALPAGTVTLHADYSWTGDIPLDPYNANPAVAPDPYFAQRFAATTQPAGGVLNARVSFLTLGDRLDLAVYGRNITNNRDITSTISFAAPLAFTSVARREPATYGVTGTFKFGSK